jgi:hypothetical protein
MRRSLLFLVAIAIVSLAWTVCHAQPTKRDDPCSELRFLPVGAEAPTVSATDVRNLPQCFNGKFIRLVGVYRTFFEVSDLYDPTDGNRLAWVTFDPFYSAVKRCTPPEILHRLNRDKAGVFGFVAMGMLRTGGHFGHLNGYPAEFQVICVEKLVEFSGPIDDAKVHKRILDWYSKER